MSYALMPPLLTQANADVYKRALSPAAAPVVSAVEGAAQAIKSNPQQNSPSVVSVGRFGGSTSFTA